MEAFAPTDPPRVAVAADGAYAAIVEPARITVLAVPGGGVLAEIGVDPEAGACEVAWVAGQARLIVLSRYAAHSTVHLVDAHGPRTVAEIRLESPMRLYATVGPHALAVGAMGAAVLTASEAHLTPYQFPARAIPVAAGAAAAQFVVALAGAIEEWDPATRMPKRRLKLPRPAVITAVGGSERVVWLTTQQDPTRVDVMPLVNRGQPKFHDLPEPIGQVSGHPKSDLICCVGADTGRLYVVDLDGRTRLRVIAADGMERVAAAALVIGRMIGVVAAQARRPVAMVALDGRDVEAPVTPAVLPGGVGGEAAPFPLEDEAAPAPVRSSLFDDEGDAGGGFAAAVTKTIADAASRIALAGPGAAAAAAAAAAADGGSPLAEAADRLPFAAAADRLPFAEAADRLPFAEAADRLPFAEAANRSPLAAAADRSPFAEAADRPPFAEAADRPPFAEAANRSPSAANRSPSAAAADRSPSAAAVDRSPSAEAAAANRSPSAANRSPSAAAAAANRSPSAAAAAAPRPPLALSSTKKPPPTAAAAQPSSLFRPPSAAPSQPARASASAAPEPIAPAQSLSERFSMWRDRMRQSQPRDPHRDASGPTSAAADASGPAWIDPRPSWRDDAVAWARGIASGALDRNAPETPALEPLLLRFELSPQLAPALLLLYGAHLAGEPGAAPVDVARALGRRWDEALGRGHLAARGVAHYSDSRVRLAPALLRLLDELPPASGTLVGEPAPIALLGPCCVIDDAPLPELAARCRATLGGAILIASDHATLSAVLLEARAFGAVAMLHYTLDHAPSDPAILVVADEPTADALGIPRL